MTRPIIKSQHSQTSSNDKRSRKSQPNPKKNTQVFLGGACNPTTWRKDQAIPYLEDAGISYYNPQVEDWSPDLICLEAEAKESALVLLFVFDPTVTRGLASLVEVAYLAAQGRVLVIVRPKISSESSLVSGENLPGTETHYIIEALRWLDTVRRPNVFIFSNISEALDAVTLLCNNSENTRLRKLHQRHSDKLKSVSSRRQGRGHQKKRRQGNQLEKTYAYYSKGSKIPKPPTVIDLYCGGATSLYDSLSQIMSLGDTNAIFAQQRERDFATSVIVQNRCSTLYFYISRNNFWLVDQMEAAYAIGSGKNVVICIESVHDVVPSDSYAARLQDSGYNSLVSTPVDSNAGAELIHPISSRLNDVEYPPTFHLSASAVKDHNRGRAYLQSVAQDEPNTRFIEFPLLSLKSILRD